MAVMLGRVRAPTLRKSGPDAPPCAVNGRPIIPAAGSPQTPHTPRTHHSLSTPLDNGV